jgi:DNA polymerase-3 subunit delta'
VTDLLEGVAYRWPIWGHRAAVELLAHAVGTDCVKHAYLFSGPDGVGKETLAQTFASALCCLEPTAPGVPCGQCRSCRKIARSVHPDVQRFGIDAQMLTGSKTVGKNTTLTIESVRMLSSTAVLRPVESRWRVLLLDDAELMQDTAQEALLKTLEEPPSFTVIVMLANDAQLLLPTVRSRCQLVELTPLPRSSIESGLRAKSIPAERAAAIAGAAGGLPGWAVRAAEQPKLLSERLESIETAVIWLSGSPYDRVVAAVKLADSFSKRRAAVFRDLEIALGVWRDALLLKTGLAEAVSFPTAAEKVRAAVLSLPLDSIFYAVRSVRQCIADLEANVRPRLTIESMVFQWPTISLPN